MRGIPASLAGTITGYYRVSAVTGLLTGLAANNPICSIRWGGATQVRPLIMNLTITATSVTPFTVAQEIGIAAYMARSWSAADTGGTALTLTAPNNLFNSISGVAPTCTILAATTGTLTAGTRTLDANPVLYGVGSQPLAAAAAGVAVATDQFTMSTADAQAPILFQSAAIPQAGTARGPEGIVVVSPIALGAGGTMRAVIDLEWWEFDPGGAGTVVGVG